MAKETDFILKMENFTAALEDLVEILRAKADENPTENLAQFLERIDADTIQNIAENLSEVKKITAKTEKNTEKIIQQLKESKKQKEKGMFGEIEDDKNKGKIIEGAKTIVLIAGAVLAIGLAFKIVGKVDFFSVVALGLSIMFVAYAFAQVASVKDEDGEPISYDRALQVSLVMAIMSLGVVGAGFILKAMPVISFWQGISAILVGASMGLAAYFLLMAMSDITTEQMLMASAVPFLLPLIAAGIVAAGFILQQMPIIGLMQFVSAIGVSIALLPIVFAFGFFMKGLKDAKMQDVLMVGLALPVISLGILLSAYILQEVPPVPFWNVLMAGIAIGIATLFLVPTIYLLQKAGLLSPSRIKDLAIGALAIVLLSAAIMASSWLLNLGTYENYPDWKWALGVGLSVLMFTPALVVLGIIVNTGYGIVALLLGAVGVLIVSAAIMASSWILSAGNYDKYPTLKWTLGVGLALIFFVPAMLTGIIMAILGPLAVPGTLLIAKTIVWVAEILASGNYDKYPTTEWSLGVGLALILFVPAMLIGVAIAILGPLAFTGTLLIASTIVIVSYLLSLGKYDEYPTTKWSSGVGLALILFVPAMILAGLNIIFIGLGFISILTVALSIVLVSWMLSIGNYDTYPTLEWAGAVGLALILFIPAMIMSGLNIIFILLGLPAIITVALGLVAVSWILSLGSYNKYPTLDWAEGVGTALLLFGMAAMSLGAFVLGGFIIGGYIALLAGIGAMLIVAGGIIAVGNFFNTYGGKFDISKVPSEKWAKGVGNALLLFSMAIAAMEDVDVDVDEIVPVMLELSKGLISVGYLFNEYGGFFDPSTVPSKEWSSNVKTALLSFQKVLQEFEESDMSVFDYVINAYWLTRAVLVAADNLKLASEVGLPQPENNTLISTLEKLNQILPNIKTDPLYQLADAIMYLRESLGTSVLTPFGMLGLGPWHQLEEVAWGITDITNSLEKLNAEKAMALYKLAMGLNLLGLIDNEALEKTLSILEDKQKSISQIIDTNNRIPSLEGGVGMAGVEEGVEEPKEPKEKTEMVALIKLVTNIDKNIDKMANQIKPVPETPLKAGEDVDGK